MAFVADLLEQRPEPTRALIPSVVCATFAAILEAVRCTMSVADGHYRETLREHTDRVGVSLYDSCGPGERFLALRAAIRAGTLKCSPRLREAQRLRQQLSMVRPKLAPNGTLSVLLPEAPDGSHCDLADVLARAVWGRQKYGGTLLPREEHVWAPGEEELQRRIERQESEDWWEQ